MKVEAKLGRIKYFAALGILVILMLTIKRRHYTKFDMTSNYNAFLLSEGSTGVGNLNVVGRALLEQRNNVSKLLNMKQQVLGQLECKEKNTTTTTGGWCEKQNRAHAGKGLTDEQLVPALVQVLKGKHIGSFGDGTGQYKELIIASGEVKGYDAYDGAPFSDIISNGSVKYLDLTLPQYGLPLYDWVLSIEVAEHIPKRFESIYIDNVVRHAQEGVILSWAKVGQGGYHHINNRPFEYVRDLMDSKGFIHDKELSDNLKSAASVRFLKWNLNVFRRKNILSKDVLMLQT
ncbi:uncharacterized protein LOC123560953 [Mercenaria mercenaria]|uniref:uncharacterized protein LOC123560953 n=1 Tax=Mercenaria mercenaria TaxID=6596 RepID=UPI001E1DDC1A|nr:uncharacterized protein LOC123560953 [Mercenaria mercenaria]